MWYAAKAGNTEARDTAKGLLDAMNEHADAEGVSVPEAQEHLKRFDDKFDASTGQGLYVPEGWTGTMPNGDEINSDSTFLSIRSFYKDDPDWPKVQAYLDGGPVPVFNYHRFWAQSDLAMAYADYGHLFQDAA
jgi:hypothetical protein